MDLARHGTGPGAVGRAYLSKVHPVFMLPPVAAAAFGAVLAGALAPVAAMVHVVAIFTAVYVAHLRDGYVDYYVRHEDADAPLTRAGFRVGIVATTLVASGCFVALYLLVDGVAVALTLPGWLIGYLHAPHLDTHPVTTTVGYPTGIALAILGGQYVQIQTLTADAIGLAVVFLVLLSGVKIIDDLQDFDWDRANRKRSAGVAWGVRRAHRAALALLVGAMLGLLGLAALEVVSQTNALAAVVFGPIVLVARNRTPRVQTMLLIRGSYLFLAVLIAVAWIEA